MKEYVMIPEGTDELGLTFEAEGDEAAIEKAKEAVPGLKNFDRVWNLRCIMRDHPELHSAEDEKGGFYELFVKQLILEDEETGEVSLAG